MIVTLSPAKSLDFDTAVSLKRGTKPEFEEDARYLNGLLKSWSAEEIQDEMKVNPKIAYEVRQFIQSFDMDRSTLRQAALAYNGIAYQGLQAETFRENDWEFAQDHLLSLSGMYGALRPMDMIKAYRLEAKIKVRNKRGLDLYAYWTDTVTQYLIKRLRQDDNIWVNLASNEYSKMINRKALSENVQIITPVFKELVDDNYKMIVVYAKKARGTMSRFIIKNKLKDVEDLKHFDMDGYSFSPDLSKGGEWVFIR